ncbi:MAG: T9SS type A sorting domain-containing protein [Bacteroidales bacterium]|nr:T9SS type A sorting domain-containing protein [Bacteroidales bacterium]
MKKKLLLIILLFCAFSINAQWVPVNNGLPDYPPTSMVNWVDTMVVSTYGGGIYLTYDQGENWVTMPGTLPNLFVNKIEYNGTQFDPISVATAGGPFICVNGGYIDCNGTGLTNNDINFWAGAPEGWPLVGDAIAGTSGDGLYAAECPSSFVYNWALSNAGLSGDALFANDALMAADFALLATEGGFYKALHGDTEWTESNIGLSGDALKINSFSYLGTIIFIATDGGLYYTTDSGESWTVILSDEKLNIAFYMNTDISPSGYMMFALGENGYSTEDFVNWNQMDFGSIEGEVTAAGADTTNLYIGFTNNTKSGKGNGGMYKKPIEQLLVGIDDENFSGLSKFSLEQNHPNPFSQSTNISYSLKKSDFVSLKVYDFAGREIKTLIHKFHEKGIYSVVFEGENLPNGIYTYKIQLGNDLYKTKKMILIK